MSKFTTITLLDSDLATLRNLTHEIRVIQDEREEARRCDNYDQVDELNERIESLKDHLAEEAIVVLLLDQAMEIIAKKETS